MCVGVEPAEGPGRSSELAPCPAKFVFEGRYDGVDFCGSSPIRRPAKVKFPGIRAWPRKIDPCDCILARRGWRFGARGEGRGAMKTAKFQVGRPRGWVRAPIVSGGRIRAMMRGCGVALLGSSPLDLRLCRPHHIYVCNVSVSSRSVSGQNAVPGIGSDSGNMSENVRFGGVAPTSLRRAAA